jgi:hypothetical protein
VYHGAFNSYVYYRATGVDPGTIVPGQLFQKASALVQRRRGRYLRIWFPDELALDGSCLDGCGRDCAETEERE